MKQFKDYENTQSYSNTEKLPAGGYVAKVLDVKYIEGQNGNSDMISLAYDIVEGDYKDFYKNQFEANTAEDKKWKGVLRIYCPKDDGSDKDNWTKRSFKTAIEHFEMSNTGYSWDWDESKLKGKLIGLIYGEINTVIEGKQVSYIGQRYTSSVDNIREGAFRIPDPQFKNGAVEGGAANNTTSASDGFMPLTPVEAEALPFN